MNEKIPTRDRVKLIALAVLILLAMMNDARAETIYEDDPRWNCLTMGNRVCGDHPTFGTPWTMVDGRIYV